MRLELEELETRALLSASGVTPTAVMPPPMSSSPGLVTPLLHVTPQQTSGNIPGYSPQIIQQAYGISSLLANGTDGTGQTIAIVDSSYDPNIVSDVAAFNSQFNLPQFGAGGPTLNVVTSDGTAVTASNGPSLGENAGWAMETALDVEWAHALAPGANILLVETPLDNNNGARQMADLLQGVAYAANNANVVSMSWGDNESTNETNLDSVFQQNPNVTFVAASGDDSAYYGPIWPATSPYVLAVGGTTLRTITGGASSAYAGETGWSGSGGGYAEFEGEPDFQTNTLGVTDARMTPDVAFDANPNTGVAIYNSFRQSQPWIEVGGTSLGSPAWAGIVALADQQSGSSLGTYQVETTLYNALNTSAYTQVFHDITSGFNGYSATPGYDLVTGLGSPIANNLVPLLANTSAAPGTPSVTGSGTDDFFSSSSSWFGWWGRTAAGGRLYVAPGSPSIPAGSEAASGLGANAAGPAGTPVLSLASAMIPLATVPGAEPSAGNTIAPDNNALLAFSLTPPTAPSGLVSNGNSLSGPSNAAAPPSATVFGASGWSGSRDSWRLSSHGLHGPAVEQVAEDLAGPLLEEVDNQPDVVLAGGDGFSNYDAPATEDGGSGGEGEG